MKKILSLLGHQEWLRFGLRSRIVRFFHNPDTASDEVFERPFFGMIYRGNFNTFIDWCVFYFGAYTKQELVVMQDFLEPKRDPVVIDVGANVGHHTLFALTKAKHVHSFEPFPPVAERLVEKLKINHIRNVTFHNVGLGDVSEFLEYTPPYTNNTGTGSFCAKPGEGESIKLRVCVADDYFRDVGITKVDFIQMDIEGFEQNALRGLRTTLHTQRPICFVEWTQVDKSSELRSGADFFPPDYEFYEFSENNPFMIFFQRRGYRLKLYGDEWRVGNLLAIPIEYIQELQQTYPRLAAACRLKGD